MKHMHLLVAALALTILGVGTASAQTTVTATWERNTDSYTAGYRLYYGTSPGSYQWSVDAGNNVTVPVTVTNGSLYYFCVRAYNTSQQYGPGSPEATLDLRPATVPTAQITATLGANNVATVTWQTTNATSATINGNAVALSGTMTRTITSQTTFALVARNAAGQTATANATVTPTVSAPTAQITATLGANNVATVTWQTTNATSATINGTTVALSGTSTTTVTAQTTFTLTARNAAGQTATASATVTPTTPAPTAQITATLQANNTALLTWQTANATSASINGNGVALSGSSSVTVNTTNGEIEVTGVGGRFRAVSTNGRIRASGLGKGAEVEATNGVITLDVSGLGDGIRAEATYGLIDVRVPKGTGADLSMRTSNGSLSVEDLDVKIAEQSRRRLDGSIGAGGPAIRLETSNGAIRVRARQ